MEIFYVGKQKSNYYEKNKKTNPSGGQGKLEVPHSHREIQVPRSSISTSGKAIGPAEERRGCFQGRQRPWDSGEGVE